MNIDESKCISCQCYAQGNMLMDADRTWSDYGCPSCTCNYEVRTEALPLDISDTAQEVIDLFKKM